MQASQKLRLARALAGTSAIALMGMAQIALAQDTPPVEGATDGDEIVVTGIRASLAASADIKREGQGVVDAISAEDMGKFPDTNLAESLQRITGVSIDRSNGEGSFVTVRGFGPEFNLVTLNGRAMPTSSLGDGASAPSSRSFDFANLASEGIASVEVYKTGRAAIPSGGIGSSINIKTPRPLDKPGLSGSIAVKGVYDSSRNEGNPITPEVSGILSTTFADDRIGIMIAGSWQKRKASVNTANVGWRDGYLGNENNWGSLTQDPADPRFAQITNRPDATDVYQVPQNASYDLNDINRERINGQAVLQFRPIDSLTATIDYTYSRNTVEVRNSNVGVWFNHNNTSSSWTDGPVAGPIFYSEAFGAGENKDLSYSGSLVANRTENKSLGGNLTWEAPGGMTMELDFHHSTAESKPTNKYGTSVSVGNAIFGVANQRIDFDYGGHLSDSLRMHVGGFYHVGRTWRNTGLRDDTGGQIRFNITREFAGGYIRFNAKFLDEQTPLYTNLPLAVSGTNSNPRYSDIAGFSFNDDTLHSRNLAAISTMGPDNTIVELDTRDGQHARSKSLGIDLKATLGEWTISEKARYAIQSWSYAGIFPAALIPTAAVPFVFGAPGGQLVYASGPQKGQAIANPQSLNGNGLISFSAFVKGSTPDFNNFTNDIRASRVWNVGGELTTTAGVYLAQQNLEFSRKLNDVLQDVVGGGRSAMVDIIAPDGSPVTQGGVLDYIGVPGTHAYWDTRYLILAPYGSLNLKRGPLSLGVSLRYDMGNVQGIARQARPTDITAIDIDNNGALTPAEYTFSINPVSNNTPVNYDYRYLSYSVSANYRFSHVFSSFGRFSKGGRAAAERILFTPVIDTSTGGLAIPDAAYDPVKQAEIGFKYRNQGVFLNFTAFWAQVKETNTQFQVASNGNLELALVRRRNSAFGGELEGGLRFGSFSLRGSATATKARIDAAENPALVGNSPRHQAALIYQISPQYDSDLLTAGFNVIGTTSSYSQDENLLKMPGFATINAFAQIRPTKGLELSASVTNVFNTKAITDVSESSLPASGVVLAQGLFGRTATVSAKVYF